MKKLEAIENRIDALERRVGASDKANQPKHVGRVHMTRIGTEQAEPTPLEPLTKEEEAFLSSQGIVDTNAKLFVMQLRMSSLSGEDKQALEGIRKKRACQLTYFQ